MRKVKILSACMLLAFGLTAHAGQGTSNELTPKEKMEKALTKNIEVVGYDDLNKKSGFQMAMYKSGSKYYLYTASFRDNGWNIVDVTNPSKPRNVKWMEGPWLDGMKDGQSTPKIQIGSNGIMVTAHGGTMKELHGTEPGLPFWGGVMIWDLKDDPENPRLLSKFECKGGAGAHRFFYNGGRYIYVTGNCEGYNGFILRIVDIEDPTQPKEVGRWWVDEQFMNNKHTAAARYGSAEALSSPFLHACVEKNDTVYCAYANKGFIMLDVKDKSNPQLIGTLPLNPPFGGGVAGAPVHSVRPLGDRPYVVVSTEGERARYFANETTDGLFKKIKTQPMNMLGIAEITDPTHPNLISVFPYPEVPEGYTHGSNFNIVDGVRIPFGPHNVFDAFGQPWLENRDDRVYCCYFNAGLRIYDVSDPFVPKEIAYFLPADPKGEDWFNNEDGTLLPGPKVAITEDVVVDDRGFIYVDAYQDGLYILKCTLDK